MGQLIVMEDDSLNVNFMTPSQEHPQQKTVQELECILAIHSPINFRSGGVFPTFRTPHQNISCAYPFSTLPIIHSELNEGKAYEENVSFKELLKIKTPDIHTASSLQTPFSSVSIGECKHRRSPNTPQKRPNVKSTSKRKREIEESSFETIEGEVVVLRNDNAAKSVPKVGIVVGKLQHVFEEEDKYVVKTFEWVRDKNVSDEQRSQLEIVAADELTIARANAVLI